MENPEEKFNQIMKKEGLEHLTRPKIFRAKIKDPETGLTTVLGEFKTHKEFEDWYKKNGIKAFEDHLETKISLEEEETEK